MLKTATPYRFSYLPDIFPWQLQVLVSKNGITKRHIDFGNWMIQRRLRYLMRGVSLAAFQEHVSLFLGESQINTATRLTNCTIKEAERPITKSRRPSSFRFTVIIRKTQHNSCNNLRSPGSRSRSRSRTILHWLAWSLRRLCSLLRISGMFLNSCGRVPWRKRGSPGGQRQAE